MAFSQENTRLQSKILKLDLGAWPQEYSEAMKTLANVQSENDKLCEDNDQLSRNSACSALEPVSRHILRQETLSTGYGAYSDTEAWSFREIAVLCRTSLSSDCDSMQAIQLFFS